MRRSHSLLGACAALMLSAAAASATNYPGNGASGFGGPVGLGSLDVTDTATSMTMTLNKGTNGLNDSLVVYFDTQPGGFVDNSTFNDNGDGGRTAISGANNGNPSRSLVTFAPGFGADYAMSIENGFIGVFQLASGGNNSFTFLFGQAQSGNGNDPSFSITMTVAQMAQMGLTAGSGQTLFMEGSYISTSAYRSNETIPASITVPADGSGNAGFSNPQTFQSDLSYTLVPEPMSLSVVGLLGVATLLRRR